MMRALQALRRSLPLSLAHPSASGMPRGSRRRAATTAAAAVEQPPGSPNLPPPLPMHLQPRQAGSFRVDHREAAAGKGKVRLDAYLSAQLPTASRAKIAASIRAGLVLVNGRPAAKPSASVRGGDAIEVTLLPPEPCTAIPEQLPLDVVYEDEHLIVVNKVPGMVVHLSPGHATGTLVNALLWHCGLPACEVASGSAGPAGPGLLSAAPGGGVLGGLLEDDEVDEAEDEGSEPQQLAAPDARASAASSRSSSSSSSSGGAPQPHDSGAFSASGGGAPGIVRPGIVHRLDRGTSGLMVVAKSDRAHAALCAQFKARSVSRVYNSITQGVPSPHAARVATNVTRDPANRLRMMAAPLGSRQGRNAASNYATLEVLAGGGAALVQWRLETGRTHQIRVHARHIGHPLLGDDTYGPGHAAAARVVAGKRSSLAQPARGALEAFGRPALHARTLGFTHPVSGARLEFDSPLPPDLAGLLEQLRAWPDAWL